MNIRDLKYIVSVAETGSFARAAELCHVSQPALSMQVKKLEEELGAKIFERGQKKFLVTAIGEEIVAKAKNILRTSEEITELAKLSKDPLAGNITIGAFPTLAPFFFPRILPNISRKLPKLKLFMVEEKTEVLVNKLLAGELDAAFVAVPINNPSLEYIEIFEDEFLAAIPTNHPLAGKDKITRADFAKEKLLLLEDGHCLRAQALEFCEVLGSYELHDFRATSMETLLGMVAQNMGVTLIPKIAASKRAGIKFIEFDKNPPHRKIGLYFRKTSARKELMQALANIIK